MRRFIVASFIFLGLLGHVRTAQADANPIIPLNLTDLILDPGGRLGWPAGDSSGIIYFKAKDTGVIDTNYIWPAAAGSPGEVLRIATVNGEVTLDWEAAGSLPGVGDVLQAGAFSGDIALITVDSTSDKHIRQHTAATLTAGASAVLTVPNFATGNAGTYKLADASGTFFTLKLPASLTGAYLWELPGNYCGQGQGLTFADATGTLQCTTLADVSGASSLTVADRMMRVSGTGTIAEVAAATLDTAGQMVVARLDSDNVQIDGNTITTTNTDGSLSIDANGIGNVNFLSNIYMYDAGFVAFRELAANGVDLVGISAPASVTTSWSMTLPAAAPSVNNSLLASTTGGASSWTSSPILEGLDILAQNELRLQDAAGGEYFGFKSPTSLNSKTYTLPADAPADGDALRITNATAGTLEWGAVPPGDVLGAANIGTTADYLLRTTGTDDTIGEVSLATLNTAGELAATRLDGGNIRIDANTITTTNASLALNIDTFDGAAVNMLTEVYVLDGKFIGFQGTVAGGGGTISLSAPATGASTYNLYLPPTPPTSNNSVWTATTGAVSAWSASPTLDGLTLATQNEVRFADAAGGQYFGLKAPTALTSKTYTLPSDAPADGEALLVASAASGTLEWGAVPPGDVLGAASIGTTANYMLRTTGTDDTIAEVTNATLASNGWMEVVKVTTDLFDVSSSLPAMVMNNTVLGPDLKRWDLINFQGNLRVDTKTDAGGLLKTILLVDRAGNLSADTLNLRDADGDLFTIKASPTTTAYAITAPAAVCADGEIFKFSGATGTLVCAADSSAADAVAGAAALTTTGAVPRVVSAGTLGSSGVSIDGSDNLSGVVKMSLERGVDGAYVPLTLGNTAGADAGLNEAVDIEFQFNGTVGGLQEAARIRAYKVQDWQTVAKEDSGLQFLVRNAGSPLTGAILDNFGGLQLNTNVYAGNGNASVPSYGWSSDSGLGMYRVSEDRLGFSAGTLDLLQLSTLGLEIRDRKKLFFLELPDNGFNFVSFKAPDNIVGDHEFVLPTLPTTNDSILTATTAGVMSFNDAHFSNGGIVLPSTNSGHTPIIFRNNATPALNNHIESRWQMDVTGTPNRDVALTRVTSTENLSDLANATVKMEFQTSIDGVTGTRFEINEDGDVETPAAFLASKPSGTGNYEGLRIRNEAAPSLGVTNQGLRQVMQFRDSGGAAKNAFGVFTEKTEDWTSFDKESARVELFTITDGIPFIFWEAEGLASYVPNGQVFGWEEQLGTDHVFFRAPNDVQAGGYTVTLPVAAPPGANYTMATADGSGNLGWISVEGDVQGAQSLTIAGRLARVSGSGALADVPSTDLNTNGDLQTRSLKAYHEVAGEWDALTLDNHDPTALAGIDFAMRFEGSGDSQQDAIVFRAQKNDTWADDATEDSGLEIYVRENGGDYRRMVLDVNGMMLPLALPLLLSDADDSDAVSIAPAAATTAYGLTMPAAQGTGALTNNGAGVLGWTAISEHVFGKSSLTTANAMPYIASAGTLGESMATLDGDGNLVAKTLGTLDGVNGAISGLKIINQDATNDTAAQVGVEYYFNGDVGGNQIAAGINARKTGTWAADATETAALDVSTRTAGTYATRATFDGSGLDVVGSITLSGTVDGRDISADINQAVTTTSTPNFAGLDLTEGNITNAGSVSLDSILPDAVNITMMSAGGNVALGGGVTASELQFMEPSASGINKIALKSPALAADVTLTLPADDGGIDECLKTDGAGVLSFGSCAAAGTVTGPGSSTDTALARWSGTSGTSLLSSGVTLDASNNLAGIGNLSLSGTVDGRDISADIDQAVTTSSTPSFARVDTTASGGIRLQDDFGGDYLALKPAATTTTWTATFPAAVCADGEVLKFSGATGDLVCAADTGSPNALTAASAASAADHLWRSGGADRTVIESAITADASANLAGINNITLSGTVDGRDISADINQAVTTTSSPTFAAATVGLVDVTAQGDLRLQDVAGGEYFAIQAAATTTTWTATAPPAVCGDGTVLKFSGASGTLICGTDNDSGAPNALTAASAATAANKLWKSAAADRTLVESGLTIDASDNLSGIGNITLSGTVDGRDISADINQAVTTTSSPTFVTVNATNLAGTLTTAAQGNVTSLGTLSILNTDNLRLDANRLSITNTDGALELYPDGTGNIDLGGRVAIDGNGDTFLLNGRQLKFREQGVNGIDAVSLVSPAALAASFTLTLPNTQSAGGQILEFDASGNASFINTPTGNPDAVLGASGITTAGRMLRTTTAGTIAEVASGATLDASGNLTARKLLASESVNGDFRGLELINDDANADTFATTTLAFQFEGSGDTNQDGAYIRARKKESWLDDATESAEIIIITREDGTDGHRATFDIQGMQIRTGADLLLMDDDNSAWTALTASPTVTGTYKVTLPPAVCADGESWEFGAGGVLECVTAAAGGSGTVTDTTTIPATADYMLRTTGTASDITAVAAGAATLDAAGLMKIAGLTVSRGVGGGLITNLMENTVNTAGSAIRLQLRNGGASSGDQSLLWSHHNVQSWSATHDATSGNLNFSLDDGSGLFLTLNDQTDSVDTSKNIRVYGDDGTLFLQDNNATSTNRVKYISSTAGRIELGRAEDNFSAKFLHWEIDASGHFIGQPGLNVDVFGQYLAKGSADGSIRVAQFDNLDGANTTNHTIETGMRFDGDVGGLQDAVLLRAAKTEDWSSDATESAGYYIQLRTDGVMRQMSELTPAGLRIRHGSQYLMNDGDNTNAVGMRAPTDVTGNYTMTFPPAPPAGNGYVLSFDTSGNATFVAPSAGSGTVTDTVLQIPATANYMLRTTGTASDITATSAATLDASGNMDVQTIDALRTSAGTVASFRGNGALTNYDVVIDAWSGRASPAAFIRTTDNNYSTAFSIYVAAGGVGQPAATERIKINPDTNIELKQDVAVTGTISGSKSVAGQYLVNFENTNTGISATTRLQLLSKGGLGGHTELSFVDDGVQSWLQQHNTTTGDLVWSLDDGSGEYFRLSDIDDAVISQKKFRALGGLDVEQNVDGDLLVLVRNTGTTTGDTAKLEIRSDGGIGGDAMLQLTNGTTRDWTIAADDVTGDLAFVSTEAYGLALTFDVSESVVRANHPISVGNPTETFDYQFHSTTAADNSSGMWVQSTNAAGTASYVGFSATNANQAELNAMVGGPGVTSTTFYPSVSLSDMSVIWTGDADSEGLMLATGTNKPIYLSSNSQASLKLDGATSEFGGLMTINTTTGTAAFKSVDSDNNTIWLTAYARGIFAGTATGAHAAAQGQLTVYSNDGNATSLYIQSPNPAAALIIRNNAETSDLLRVYGEGGLVVGTPTGGNKGIGTINASAIYDDDVLLTDHLLECAELGYALDGEPCDMLSLDEARAFVAREYHLPSIDGREKWESEGKFSLGALVTQIWEATETNFIYIAQQQDEIGALRDELRARDKSIESLEARLERLEARILP